MYRMGAVTPVTVALTVWGPGVVDITLSAWKVRDCVEKVIVPPLVGGLGGAVLLPPPPQPIKVRTRANTVPSRVLAAVDITESPLNGP
jgi:hypothetical protein